MHFLFVKDELSYPRVSGHDVHTYWMMRSLHEAGHEISLLTVEPSSQPAIEAIDLKNNLVFSPTAGEDDNQPGLTRLQKKFCSYWGISNSRIREVANHSRQLKADTVVAVGLDVLPYLSLVKDASRVWYAADEWVIHHLSQFSPCRPPSWSNLKHAAVKGLYERAFASVVDRTWLVSDRDARWARRIMPRTATDVVPNGVDTEHYSPQVVTEADRSCVFWGRLDFGPNLDAIEWFCKNVWGEVRSTFVDAKFTVFGFKPGEAVRQLANKFKFELITDLPDIRQQICAHQVVVLPFVSGAGIKNKLLEAASLSRPIIASKTALNGVDTGTRNSIQPASGRRQWIKTLTQLWDDQPRRQSLGQHARAWVMAQHTWPAAAQRVIKNLQTNSE